MSELGFIGYWTLLVMNNKLAPFSFLRLKFYFTTMCFDNSLNHDL
jgi:hypothetical protein